MMNTNAPVSGSMLEYSVRAASERLHPAASFPLGGMTHPVTLGHGIQPVHASGEAVHPEFLPMLAALGGRLALVHEGERFLGNSEIGER